MANPAEIEAGLASKKLLNLNDLSAREDLLPALTMFSEPAERDLVARKIYYVSGGLSNVGAIARIRITGEDVRGARGLKSYRDRLKDRDSITLLTGEQLRQLKPLFVVRSPARFRRSFLLWSALFLAVFLLAHAWFSLRGFRGDQYLLPAVMLLSGAGLILMAALRDPVRDTLLFADFAQGVVVGCVLLAVAAMVDFERLSGRLTFIPLLASFVLSAALILFGSGPGLSDAKVNLLGFQPVEIIRVLLVLFLAGYFASRWDVLRHARESRASLAKLTSRIDIPPVEYTLPAVVCVALSLVFFFLQKDMGPALVFACLFLVLYGIARGSVFVPAVGLTLVACGFLFGYVIGVPHTVGERVSMWLSPWNNVVHGGDQLAHSLWAYATGGIAGMGIGQGDPQLVPAGHTDLILAALGEEWGFLGVAAVFAPLRSHRLARSANRSAGAHRLRFLPGHGTGSGHRAADPPDRGRLARRAAALRSGHALPQLWPHRHDHQFPGDRNAALDLGVVQRESGARHTTVPPAATICGRGFRHRGRRDSGEGGVCGSAAQRRCNGRRHAGHAGRWRTPLSIQSALPGRDARDSQGHASTIAMACRWPPAIGTNWKSTAPNTSSSASTSPPPAPAATAATIPSAA